MVQQLSVRRIRVKRRCCTLLYIVVGHTVQRDAGSAVDWLKETRESVELGVRPQHGMRAMVDLER